MTLGINNWKLWKCIWNKYLQWVVVSWTSCVFVFCSKIFADRDGQLVFKCTFRQCRNPSLPAGSWNTAEDLFYFQFPSVLLQLLYSHLLSWVVALRQLKRNIFAFFLLCACVCSRNSYLSFHSFCILSAVLCQWVSDSPFFSIKASASTGLSELFFLLISSSAFVIVFPPMR